MKDNDKKLRHIIFSDEFTQYFEALDERTKNKFDECIKILENIYVVNTKFAKRIIEADEGIYEMRVSVGFNEYRTIIFAIDHENLIQAKQVVLLNSFLKKDTKDYKKQIKKAINILNKLGYEA